MFIKKQHEIFSSIPVAAALIASILLTIIFQPIAAASTNSTEAAPIKYEYFRVSYDVNSDFTFTESYELAITALSDRGVLITKLMQLNGTAAGWRSKFDVEVTTAYTRKKNGEHINTILRANEYSPIKWFDFPQVEVGDTVVASYKIIRKEAVLPNNIVIVQDFSPYLAYEDVEVSLYAPASLNLRIEAIGGEKSINTDGARRMVWKYRNENPEAIPSQPQPQRLTSAPGIHISTFKDDAAERDAYLALSSILQTQQSPEASRIETRPLADKAMIEAVAQLYPRPLSDWKSTEKSIYQKLLSNGKFDALVVPFQVQEYALDRPTRSLMTAQLALAVADALHLRVPDPYLIERALGDGDRRFIPADIYNLADKLGVKKIIWGYVGHDRANHMAITIQSQDRDPQGVLNAQTSIISENFENIDFTDERPPIEVYQQLLPKILSAIGIDSSALSMHKPVNRPSVTGLPPSPLAMVKKDQIPSLDALYFQLLAYLTPDNAETTKGQFAGKSYLATLGISPNSPDYRILKARSLMLLGLRPAALQVLKQPKTTEEKELFEMLNGNLPQVEKLSTQVGKGIGGLLAKMDAHYLGDIYKGANQDTTPDTVSLLKLPGDVWPFLFMRSYADLDAWAQFENIYLKQLLDYEFPIKDYTAEGMISGATSLNDTDKLQNQMDLSVISHIRKLLETDAATWCCQFTPDRPAAMDYLNLIEAIGEDNLIRHANFMTYLQGVPERALEYLNRIEYVYKGHPHFSWERGYAEIRKAESTNGAEKESLLKSAYDNLLNAIYWEQGQTVFSNFAFRYLGNTLHRDYGESDNVYSSDLPFRPYYNQWERDSQRPVTNAETALNNSIYSLEPFKYLDWYFTEISKQPDRQAALLKSVDGRFSGNPAMYQLLARKSLEKGDIQSAERYYLECIKAQPVVWQAYKDLGTLLFERGQLKKAAELYMSYPAFKEDPKENPVIISNAAYEAGSKFYWIGEYSLAAPLYRLASREKTGSNADITSRIRLNLIDGDFRGALFGSLESANRYNNTYAYRDYLGLLHAAGASKEAWDAFNVLANQFDDPHIWEAALVGHRKEVKTEAEIALWVKQKVENSTGRDSNLAA